MSNAITILVTLSNGDYILQCAMRLDTGMLTPDEVSFALEPENKEKIYNLLPGHVRGFGSIVEVKEIYEVVDLTD